MRAPLRAFTPPRAFRRRLSHLRICSVNDVYELHNLPRLRSLVRAKRAEHSGAFITTMNGDFVSPSILSGLDKGQGMVEALNSVPISHCCFGNHEADIQLADLAERTVQFRGMWLNSNLPDFRPKLPPYDVVEVATPSGIIRVGLIGLLTSEHGVFRKDRFRGLAIEDTLVAAARWSDLLRTSHGVRHVIALTHQSVGADEVLAQSGSVDLILGGHEHEIMEVRPAGGAPIVKGGSDAHAAAVVDVAFGEDGGMHVDVVFEDVASYADDAELGAEVDVHLRTLRALESEAACSSSDSPATHSAHLAGVTLSSKRTRFEQTSVGTLITTLIRDCLQTDVATINGGTIKGNRT